MSLLLYYSRLRKSQVLRNIGFILATQVVNYIFPFITIKYLVNVLGAESFGKVSFAQSFTAYFIVLVDFGFGTYATQAIAVKRENSDAIKKIYYNIFYAKAILLLLGALILGCSIFFMKRFVEDQWLYLTSFGVVIGTMMFPQWYFQGVEKMGYITLINTIIKIVFLCSIFLLVKRPDDYTMVPILNSCSYLVPGLIGFAVAKKKIGKPIRPVLKDIKGVFKDGSNMFITCVMSTLISGSSIFILGLVADDSIVGYYSGFDKVARASTLLIVPITLGIYPTVSRKFSQSTTSGYEYIKKIGVITVTGSTVIAIGLIVFSRSITNVLYSPDFLNYRIVLHILAAWTVISSINNFIGVQYLTGSGRFRLYGKAFIITAIFSIPMLYTLTYRYSYIGTAISALLGECLLTVTMLVLIYVGIQKSNRSK